MVNSMSIEKQEGALFNFIFIMVNLFILFSNILVMVTIWDLFVYEPFKEYS